jgi:Ca-activated chloride channel homolog
VIIKQRYRNQEQQPIEGVYEFTLDPNASIYNFWAEIDGKKIVGKIEEKEKAINKYDDAMASGHGAYLLEQKKQDKFSASVGNLPPQKEALICIEYVTELFFNDQNLIFTLPSHSFPLPAFPSPSPLSFDKNRKSLFSDQVGEGLQITANFGNLVVDCNI